VLRFVERGLGAGLGAAFRGVGPAAAFSATGGFTTGAGFATGAGFDAATGLDVEVAATDLGALVFRGARRRVTGFLTSVSGGSVSATAMLP
jgi:hypothetical protein